MSITLATGTQIAVGTTFGASKTFTAASNASECVLSFAADPSLAANDIFHITSSGWALMKDVVARVKAVSGSGPYLVTLEGFDTTSTTLFPAGEGAGAGKEVTAWASIPLVADVNMTGGGQGQVPTPLLALPTVGSLPGDREGIVFTMPAYFEATADTGIAGAVAAQAAGVPCALRATHPNGDKLYASAFWSVRRTPTMQRNQPRASEIVASFTPVDPMIYAS